MMRGYYMLISVLIMLCCVSARAQTSATVLFVANERMTALALHYPYFPQFARLGFGPSTTPWHPWFGSLEMRALVHLPAYVTGTKVEIERKMLLGSGFRGQSWKSAFAALASFDTDGNGIVEAEELRDLYVWVDFQSNGTVAARDDALISVRKVSAGFDLRADAKSVNGYARTGRLAAFSVIGRRGARSHLLELDIGEGFPSRDRAYLSYASVPAQAAVDGRNTFTGQWRWTATNADQWKDVTRPWGKEAGGRLLLAVTDKNIGGVVHYIGPYGDHINLPLQGVTSGREAQWTSVSPLGLTRSEVRLEQIFGHPVLRARSWSNRNGKVLEWTWEAVYEKQID